VPPSGIPAHGWWRSRRGARHVHHEADASSPAMGAEHPQGGSRRRPGTAAASA
jgi:hypothetical protein